ncbi:flavodoxin family protein [Clostridium sp. SYSU_GA19001]|uniref:flavodoxin family protein n=1 Tax=Clostridium caldaquaticum TaxID=2940653 RepID=UPI00207701CB|nr:flavodoxin family protein [Clostridium caldaquaticum]MCM8709931.1 flavodoxin family protein [Clostridium caldaquaticum]
MKVLGISFGRKMGNTDILVKEALFGAKSKGAEVEFVNTVSMNIGRCIGCGACSSGFRQGKDAKCIIKDDYHELEQKVLDADAIIVGAPVYVLQPVGQFKDFVDRFGPMHDMAAMKAEQDKRMERGETDNPVDPRYFKKRYVGYISVGGATTKNWVSMGLPTLHLFGISSGMKAVGEIDAYKMGETGNPVLDEALIANANTLGVKVTEAVGKPDEEIEWYGEEGTCPVCHQNLITLNGTTTVECPVCGIEGKLSVDGDKVNVTFSKEQQARARGTYEGLLEHYLEITGFGAIAGPKLQAAKDRLPALLQRYKDFDKLTK